MALKIHYIANLRCQVSGVRVKLGIHVSKYSYETPPVRNSEKIEHRTSNVQHRTLNIDDATLYLILKQANRSLRRVPLDVLGA